MTLVTLERRPPSGDRAWILTLLPAFPLLLLVLRVWYLSRQDLQTMLLVLQSASPLGLIASLLISLLWALPAVVLLLRVLFLLLLVSVPTDGRTPGRSWLARGGVRMPVWLSPPAALLALLTWQLRFLPTLLALALVIGGLEARRRFGAGRFTTAVLATAVPVAAGVLGLIWFLPGIVRAFGPAHEPLTAVLLLVPPIAAPMLCGPVPAPVARWLLPGTAGVLALCAPILLGAGYLHTPVLPRVAVESRAEAGPADVQRGSLVSVDDRFTTLLDADGEVHFLPNSRITAQVLCFTGPEPPGSSVSVHGWPVEQSVLSWAAPRPLQAAPDERCRGS